MRSGAMLIDEGETKKPVAHNPLEQFVLLAKGTKGAACQDLIKTVLEAPGVYVFSELLAHPNIREVIYFIGIFYAFVLFSSFNLSVCVCVICGNFSSKLRHTPTI